MNISVKDTVTVSEGTSSYEAVVLEVKYDLSAFLGQRSYSTEVTVTQWIPATSIISIKR